MHDINLPISPIPAINLLLPFNFSGGGQGGGMYTGSGRRGAGNGILIVAENCSFPIEKPQRGRSQQN